MRPSAQPFLWKWVFICMIMKNHFLIKGWALNLVLIRRPRVTQKWPIGNIPKKDEDEMRNIHVWISASFRDCISCVFKCNDLVFIYFIVIFIMFIPFVRTLPNLGVLVVQSHKFSRCRGRLPISRPHWFYQGHLGRETGLLPTRFRFRKWQTWICN